MGKILQKHFLLSWRMAVSNAKLLLSGLVDLEQKKYFVSSLHNAIEIGCKQILIDENDYSVINHGNIKDMKLLKKYSEACINNDLNKFFSSLNNTQISDLFSIEFNALSGKFVSKIKKEEKTGNVDEKYLKKCFSILQKLRNNETHFYIDDNEYLKIDELKMILDLMTIIFKYFDDKELFSEEENYGYRNVIKNNLEYFDVNNYTIKDYETLIKNSRENIAILNSFKKVENYNTNSLDSYIVEDKDEVFKIIQDTYGNKTINIEAMSFIEFYRRFCILLNNGFLFIENNIEIDCEKNPDYGYVPHPMLFTSIYRTNK